MHHRKEEGQKATPRRIKPSASRQGERPSSQWWDEEMAERQRREQGRYRN